jgi:hypothetical protein
VAWSSCSYFIKLFTKLDCIGRALTALLIAIALATGTTMRSLPIIT